MGVRARWYLLALVPLGIGAVITVFSLRGLFDLIEHMPRVVVPGKGEIALEAGDHVVYGETQSLLNGTVYVSPSLQLRCGMRAPGGDPIELTAPSATTSYRIGGFAGQSMFKLTIPRAGTYLLACEGDGAPATIAVGTGLGAELLIAVVGLLGGLGGVIVIVFIVRRRRRRSRVAHSVGTAVPPAAPA